MLKRLFLLLSISSIAQAMVFDNRFLPLLLKPFTRRCDALSHVRLQPFFMHADEAFSELRHLDLPDINGCYDQRILADAMNRVGFDHPLRSDFRFRSTLPWCRIGRLDAQGLAFLYEQAITPWFSIGINTLFAHVSMRHEFLLQDNQLDEGDREYLFQVKDAMHRDLGVCAPLFSKTGFGDIDFYLRFGYIWDYTLKFRRIDSSIKFGVLIPSAEERDIDNPASIPLGGNRHWGIYGALENEWELKEDLSFGWMFRASKRFEKTQCLRMPLLGEPAEYGTIVGPFRIDPGWTFVFNPYLNIAGLRRGFGVKALYTLVAHLKDRFIDKRPFAEQRQFPAQIPFIENASSWGSEFVTIGAYYDFGKVRECPTLYPKISAYWDIPVNWLVSKRAAKTSSVSLMLSFDF